MCKNEYYKSKYLIAFYDKRGEELIKLFDNVKQILSYKNLEINTRNLKLTRLYLYRALISDSHYTKMLDGTLMTVWTIDMEDDTDI